MNTSKSTRASNWSQTSGDINQNKEHVNINQNKRHGDIEHADINQNKEHVEQSRVPYKKNRRIARTPNDASQGHYTTKGCLKASAGTGQSKKHMKPNT